MDIIEMTIADYESILSLWKNTSGMGLNSIDDSKEGIKKYLDRNPKTCFVAKEDKRLLGVILSGHDGRRGFIYHTAVVKEERNGGIGKALVGRAIEALKKEGICKVALVVRDGNEIGNKFWEKIGFSKREDLIYRDRVITEMKLERMDT
jgi:ribosomal protein S18 acetylase RimI-like enzyme